MSRLAARLLPFLSLVVAPALAAGELPPSLTHPVEPLDAVELLAVGGVDMAAVDRIDRKRAEEGLPPRFAHPVAVAVTPSESGSWETLPDGRAMWRMRFASEGALSLNFGFTRFFLPPTAELWVSSPDSVQILGPYTERDNDAHRELWTPVVLGDTAVVELVVRPDWAHAVELEVGRVNHGYTGFGYPRPAGESGSCNVDVVCDEDDGDPQYALIDSWRDQIRSSAVYQLGGAWTCSGALVNNVRGDLKPYFLTADHCGISPSNDQTMVVYWNYETSVCGGIPDGSLAQNQTGATFLSDYGSSDFTLVELDDPPAAHDPDPYWSGWDATGADLDGGNPEKPSAVAIHHPGTDEKRISFEYQPTTTTSYLGDTSPGNGTHIRVDDWDMGTTEGGSSGSPLYTSDGLIAGQLHGGYAACGNDEPDWYGKVSVSWLGDGTSSGQLKAWLDPDGTGVDQLPGRDACVAPTFDYTISPNPVGAGVPVTFDAVGVTGTGPFEFEWDLDGDGAVDCTTDPCQHTYTAYYDDTVSLRVVDVGESCDATVVKAMLVNAARVAYASTGSPVETCGDGDATVEPGERWTVPVTVSNTGNRDATSAHAQVTVAGGVAGASMVDGTLDFGTVAPGADATGFFEFGIEPGFAPCGAPVPFDLGDVVWTGGSVPGVGEVYTAATGGGTGTVDALAEAFEDPSTWHGLGDPALVTDAWVVTTGPGAHTAGEWTREPSGAQGQPSGGSGFFAVADSDDAGSGSYTSSTLYSPVVDLSGVLSGTVTVEVDLSFNHYSSGGSEWGQVEAWDGGSWVVLERFDGSTGDVDAHRVYDVSAQAVANPDFRLRFDYQDANYDWWFSVDTVRVVAPVDPVCDFGGDCLGNLFVFSDGFESGDAGAWSASTP